MNKLLSIITTLLVFAGLTGCSALTGEEIARLAINQVSTDDNNLIIKETSLSLKKGDEIAFWSEMDMKYEGDVTLQFQIEVLKDGENLGILEIDTTEKNITLGELKTSIMGKTDWSFTGKNSEFKIEDDGNYTFKGILVATKNPTLIINKAEIVLKI
ncbi:hypothetical protein ABW636_10115 [Aquimarina sp. 2201CG1-2-11]|uniref:hypothetical protein n=1 Tax=Aquimarina discodermiae TaxID=3231043 RepID=UPI0034619BCA